MTPKRLETVERCLAREADAVGTAKRWKKAKRRICEEAYRRKCTDRRPYGNASALVPRVATQSASQARQRSTGRDPVSLVPRL